MSDPFGFLPNAWSEFERDQYTDAFGSTFAFNDGTAQALFNEGYFNHDIGSDERIAIRDALNDYLLQEYGIDFDAVFDWEAWREAYGEAA